MSTIGARPRTIPLVTVLYRVPLFAVALEGAFDGIAELQTFRTDGGAAGLLRSLEPDAVIVEGEYENALAFAREAGIPVFEVDLERGTFESQAGPLPVDPAALRNAVVGALRSRT